MVAPYPPGIPVLYPGEEISQAVWDYIECFRRDKRRIHGADLDGETDQINGLTLGSIYALIAGKDGRLDFVKVVESSFSDI